MLIPLPPVPQTGDLPMIYIPQSCRVAAVDSPCALTGARVQESQIHDAARLVRAFGTMRYIWLHTH